MARLLVGLAAVLTIAAILAPTSRSAAVIPSVLPSGAGHEVDQRPSGTPDGAQRHPPLAPQLAQLSPMPAHTPRIGPAATAGPRPVRTSSRPAGMAEPTPTSDSRIHSDAVTLRGKASWYATGGPGAYAAMGGYRDGTRVIVAITAFHDGRAFSITVPVVTQCGACRWRAGAVLVDLSVEAWDALGWPLGLGLIAVTVTILEGSVG